MEDDCSRVKNRRVSVTKKGDNGRQRWVRNLKMFKNKKNGPSTHSYNFLITTDF